MEDKLNGLRGGIFNLTNKTELQTKLISNITTTLVEGLRRESHGDVVWIQGIYDSATKIIMTQGAQTPNDQPIRANTSLFWIKEYFETEVKSVIEEMNKMLISVKHTTLHSSFSNEKITPATMADLIRRVEQCLGNIS